MSAIVNGGPVPKEAPYGRLNNFNQTARYTITVKRNLYTAVTVIQSQDITQFTGNPFYIYNGDIIEILLPGAPSTSTHLFSVQQLSSGSWISATAIGMAAYQQKRTLTTTVTGTAATSTVSFSG